MCASLASSVKFALLCFLSLPVSLLIPALRGLSQNHSRNSVSANQNPSQGDLKTRIKETKHPSGPVSKTVPRFLVLKLTPSLGSVVLSKSDLLRSLGFNSNPPHAPSFQVPRSTLSGNARYQQPRPV